MYWRLEFRLYTVTFHCRSLDHEVLQILPLLTLLTGENVPTNMYFVHLSRAERWIPTNSDAMRLLLLVPRSWSDDTATLILPT